MMVGRRKARTTMMILPLALIPHHLGDILSLIMRVIGQDLHVDRRESSGTAQCLFNLIRTGRNSEIVKLIICPELNIHLYEQPHCCSLSVEIRTSLPAGEVPYYNRKEWTITAKNVKGRDREEDIQLTQIPDRIDGLKWKYIVSKN